MVQLICSIFVCGQALCAQKEKKTKNCGSPLNAEKFLWHRKFLRKRWKDIVCHDVVFYKCLPAIIGMALLLELQWTVDKEIDYSDR